MSLVLFLSEMMIPLIIFYIVGFGVLARRPVFDDFLTGAKEGMKSVVGILPTLIGLMTAVGVLRTSGVLEMLADLLQIPAGWLRIPKEIVPVTVVRMISNSAATGLVLDIFKNCGPDSYLGNLTSIMMGCTETVFYVSRNTKKQMDIARRVVCNGFRDCSQYSSGKNDGVNP